MVNKSVRLDAAFAALADPTRRAILARLSRGETTVSELAAPFEISLPAVLKHVGALESAGLVEARKEGRVRRCRLRAEPLDEAASWIESTRSFWKSRLDVLAAFLEGPHGKEESSWPRPKPRSNRSASRKPSPRRPSASSARSSSRRP